MARFECTQDAVALACMSREKEYKQLLRNTEGLKYEAHAPHWKECLQKIMAIHFACNCAVDYSRVTMDETEIALVFRSAH